SLLGLGGGILIVPLLTLGFGLPVREAVGVSLVCVIVTSSAAAAVYLERHVANLRLGMTLELFTAVGAGVGGIVAFVVEERVIAALFTALLVYTAWSMARPGAATVDEAVTPVAPPSAGDFRSSLNGAGYVVRRLPAGMVGAFFAGIMAALLGVGGGLVKVPVMHLVMGVPLRVATATSNLMIGVTATAGAVVYLARGGIDPFVAGPTAIGVFFGAALGSRAAHRIDVRTLRLLFMLVLGYTALQMGRRVLAV
ncbi:MAG: hypothetical protein C4343_00695, partial [Chloroflexota bacterium]